MQELLNFLARLADCLGQHYYDKSQAVEILKKTNIDFLAIDINGSTRDIWWNIIQYISSNDPSTMDKLIRISLEENPQSSCLTNLNNPFPSGKKSRSKGNSVKEFLSPKSDGSIIDNLAEKGMEALKDFLDSKSILESGFSPDAINNEQEHFASTLENSFAVGLIENTLHKSFSTGFLISAGLVAMPTFVISDKSNIEHLKFRLHNPLQKKFKEYIFDKEPYLIDPKNQTMILRLNKSILGIKSLKIASENDLKKLDKKAFSLISFPKLNKSITTVSNLKLNNNQLIYQTASAEGSAGGAILMGDLLIGMHIGKTKTDEQKVGVNLIPLLS